VGFSEYMGLETAMKALAKEPATTEAAAEVLKVGRYGLDTGPDDKSYGLIQPEFEAGAMRGDNLKQDRAIEGSFDLYSEDRDGDGWIPLIESTLNEHCEGCWSLNSDGHENSTHLFHWEWVFQI